jgi:hypothetical protein
MFHTSKRKAVNAKKQFKGILCLRNPLFQICHLFDNALIIDLDVLDVNQLKNAGMNVPG